MRSRFGDVVSTIVKLSHLATPFVLASYCEGKTMKKIIGALAGCALLSVGCVSERAVEGNYNEDLQEFELEDRYGNLQAFDGHLEGDIGNMRKMDADATVDGYDEGDYTTMEVLADTDDGAAMHWLEIYGGVNHPALQPGARLSFDGNSYNTNPNALYIQAMGCAGPAPYEWDVDEPARNVSVEVEDGPQDGTVLVNYTTEVPNTANFGTVTDDTSSGSFVLRR